MQNINYNNSKFNSYYNQINHPFIINPYNKEINVQRLNNKRKSSDSRKSVTFSPNVSIIDVESWKKYNTDMAQDTEYMRLKNKIQYLKERKKLHKYNEHEDCCNIY